MTLILALLLSAIAAFAQGLPKMADALTGKYEGTVKDQKVTLELFEPGKPGHLQHGQNSYDVTGVMVADAKVSFAFGKDGKFNGKIDGDKIVGEMSVGGQKTPVELKKVPAAAAAAPADGTPATAASSAPVNLSGDWDAVADANGQPFPFVLVLKVDGETVTGSSSSQLGEATVKQGTWKDGKLSIQLEGTNGTITLTAAVVEGKLSGEYDYAGQLSGKWVAVRKQ
jgi:hypothetical protein